MLRNSTLAERVQSALSEHITASTWWTGQTHITIFQVILFMGTGWSNHLGDMAAEQTPMVYVHFPFTSLYILNLLSIIIHLSSAEIELQLPWQIVAWGVLGRSAGARYWCVSFFIASITAYHVVCSTLLMMTAAASRSFTSASHTQGCPPPYRGTSDDHRRLPHPNGDYCLPRHRQLTYTPRFFSLKTSSLCRKVPCILEFFFGTPLGRSRSIPTQMPISPTLYKLLNINRDKQRNIGVFRVSLSLLA